MYLSEKHGLNPSIQVCSWCGESMGIVMFGRNGGKEAPRQIVMDYDPCEKCQADWKKGACIIEVSFSKTKHTVPISKVEGKDVFPTGRLVVMKTEVFARMFPDETLGPLNQVIMGVDDFSLLFNEEIEARHGDNKKTIVRGETGAKEENISADCSSVEEGK